MLPIVNYSFLVIAASRSSVRSRAPRGDSSNPQTQGAVSHKAVPWSRKGLHAIQRNKRREFKLYYCVPSYSFSLEMSNSSMNFTEVLTATIPSGNDLPGLIMHFAVENILFVVLNGVIFQFN